MEPFRGLYSTIEFTLGRRDVPATMDTVRIGEDDDDPGNQTVLGYGEAS